MKKTILSALVASALLSGCGSDDNQTADSATPLDVQTTFSARYIQTLPSKKAEASAYALEQQASTLAEQTSQVRYLGKLEVTNVASGEENVFDWPVTQTVDAEGNVTTTSHRALTLKPGTYDFALLLTTEGANPKQYLANALAVDVVEGEQPAIKFIVEPNLGDTITDFDDIAYVSKLAFQWQAEELAALNKPQFGLSVNGNDEQVFEINKETGLAEITMNVEPGEYTLSLRLYDGDLMVGKNEDDTTVNFVEGEDAQTDIIPLQADVIFEVAEIKDRGTIAFTIPDVVIEEVGGVENLTLKASITAQGIAPQEHVLEILDVNGTHIAEEMLETGGAKNLGVHLEFYNTNASQDLADLTPFTRCNTTVTVEANQTLGCKLELKRESIITNRILGTLRINAVNENWTPAEGADVFLNGEKVGVTGSEIGAGTFKTHLVAGEYQVEIKQGMNVAREDIRLQPLDVENAQLILGKDASIGTGNFIKVATYDTDNWNSRGDTGDIDGDGHIDLVVATRDKTVDLYFGDGTGKFKEITELPLPKEAASVTIGDFDGDGKQDLVVMGHLSREANPAHMIYHNEGLRTFTLHQTINDEKQGASSTPTAFLSDMDKDGTLELVAAIGRSNVGIYTQDTQHHFTLKSTHYVSTDREFAVGDVNNDGYPDIITREVLINNQQGGFTPLSLSLHDAANIKTQQLTDFDNDGDLDLLVTTSWENLTSVYLNNGMGQFTFSSHISAYDTSRELPAIGDINNDGLADVVMSVAVPNEGTNSSSLKFNSYTNDINLTFNEKNIDGGGGQALLADLDNDGDLDLISIDFDVTVYKNAPTN
ncbi:FG-GAP repeat domain-containing protein [Enterovibrio baiacu]|uniref:FG-GAP repeat domain-containing protein n=1 Tax=Enterovibrio baiacu TaxID=2491023 RepID=UPI0010121A25|nr:VCBS repeat-containing protein [Enterovibrio baiacu]MBE1275007.1 hypothetical protein [Enterovibrio baiacu]